MGASVPLNRESPTTSTHHTKKDSTDSLGFCVLLHLHGSISVTAHPWMDLLLINWKQEDSGGPKQ